MHFIDIIVIQYFWR